jgi:histidinol-phosphate aminotransferase
MSDSPTPPVVLRQEILDLPAYKQGKSLAGGFKLSSNENPFPPLPGVLEAVQAASAGFNRYPNAAAPELTSLLAGIHGVADDQVVIGAGSVSLLVQLIQAAAGAGDEVLYSWRSFEAYPWMPTLTGAQSVRVPNRADHGHDLDAMLAAITARTRVVIVCSPNNPTSTVVGHDEFRAFMDRVPTDLLVILDQAYIEFTLDSTAVSGMALLNEYPNLVVLRTFSKAYGLAGLRLGYGIGHPAVISAAKTTGIPLGITDQAQAAGIASLASEGLLAQRVEVIAERRDALWAGLLSLGFDVPRPHGNFVWLPLGEHTAAASDLYSVNGMTVRAFPPEGLRISVGEHESVEKLLEVSAKVVEILTSRQPS